MRHLALVLLAACGGRSEDTGAPASGAPTGGTTASTEAAPNLLILLADDMGQDVVGAYGRHPDPPRTPVIDGLAADGVRFRNAWAYPVCSPTRAAILTGRYGRRTGIGDTVNAQTNPGQLDTDEVLLPAMLRQSPHGYQSIGTGKWHLAGWHSADGADHPLVMGFDHFDGHMGNLNEAYGDNPEPTERGYYWHEWSRDGEIGWSDVYATTETVDQTLERIDAMPEPWAAYVAFHAPHTPLALPPEDLAVVEGTGTPSESDVYRAMVEAMDAEIGRLLDGLDPEVRARTLVVFAGDNGTSPMGTTWPWDSQKAKNSPFEGGVAVPLIVTGPGVVEPGREEDALVHVLDLFATAAEVAGVDEVLDAQGRPVVLDSQSLVPYLADPDAPHGRTYLYTEKFGPNGAPPHNYEWNILRDERWKLMRRTGQVLFFDLDQPDPITGNEGEELVAAGLVTTEQQEAFDRLSSELDALLAEITYD